MTKDELKKLIYSHTAHSNDFDVIWNAVEAYSSASNDAKPPVSGLLPPMMKFIEAWGKENKRQIKEYVYDSAGGSEAFISEAAIEEWFMRQ